MPRPESLSGLADRWLFAPGDAHRLASLRIGLCGVLALRLATANYRVVAGQPAPLFQPVSYMKLFDRMPSVGAATTLQVCGVLAAVVAAAGLALRVSLPVALLCSLGLDGMLNSTGRVIVGDAVLTLCLVVLLASGDAAGEAWSLRAAVTRARASSGGGPSPLPPVAPEGPPSSERYGWPVRTAMVTAALSLFFAGLQKLRYSGLAWVTSGNLRWILYASSDSRPHPDGLALFIAGRPWLAHLCAGGALLLELGFPLVLFAPRLRWPLVMGAVAMHEAIRLATGIDYTTQALTVLIVFVDWPSVVASVRRRVGPRACAGRDLALSRGSP